MTSIRNLLALAVLALGLTLVGCGGSGDRAEGSEGDGTAGAESPEDSVGSEGGDSVASDEGTCAEGGHAPVAGEDGVPTDCEVLYEGCCYSAARACEVAGCEADACNILESYPGQVRCAG